MPKPPATLFVILGAAVFAVIAAVTVSSDHHWGGDFSMYIAHARNLTSGIAYLDTGFIETEANPLVRATPPGLPWLLAPIYAIWGMNLVLFKAVLIVSFSIAVVVIFFLVKKMENAASGLLVAAILIANPYVWEFRENVLSEFPFILWSYAAFLLIAFRDGSTTLARRLSYAFLAGSAIYLAYATRTMGLAVLLAVLVSDYFRRRDFVLDTLPIITVFGIGAVAQSLSLRIDTSHVELFSSGLWQTALVNSAVLIDALRHTIFPWPSAAQQFIPYAIFAAVIMGLYAAIARHPGPGSSPVLRAYRCRRCPAVPHGRP